MSALGTLGVRDVAPFIAPRIPATNYQIVRGNPLGAVGVVDRPIYIPAKVTPLDSYIVRMIAIVYRQLWPSHGQRFPQ